jgi:integrase
MSQPGWRLLPNRAGLRLGCCSGPHRDEAACRVHRSRRAAREKHRQCSPVSATFCIVNEVRVYLDSIPEGPMFPNIKLDRYGKVSKNAGEHLSKWIRSLGIDRKGEAFHCFRHTAKTAYRRSYPAGEDMRNYLTAHASGSVAADYGRFPISALREVVGSLPTDPLKWELE